MIGQRSRVDTLACQIVGEARGSDIVLLHGWACDHRFLEAQLAFFSKTSRVIVPDLPGFGNSAPIPEPSVPNLAREILNLLERIGTLDAVIIGHSMGGLVGLELSHLAPNIVGRLAMLDTVLWPTSELAGAVSSISQVLHAGNFEEAIRASKAALFLPGDHSSAIELFEETFRSSDPTSLVQTFDAHLIEYSAEYAAKALICPAAYIGTDTPLASFSILASKMKGIRIGKVIGSGHFAPLLVPEQVNALLAGFLSATTRSS